MTHFELCVSRLGFGFYRSLTTIGMSRVRTPPLSLPMGMASVWCVSILQKRRVSLTTSLRGVG